MVALLLGGVFQLPVYRERRRGQLMGRTKQRRQREAGNFFLCRLQIQTLPRPDRAPLAEMGCKGKKLEKVASPPWDTPAWWLRLSPHVMLDETSEQGCLQAGTR